jgi:hypothetical protein
MMSFLRSACGGGQEEPRPTADPGEEIGPRSLANEAQSLLALAAACAEALRRFPTSLEEDEALLRSHWLSRNARNAILMRRGEKRVLHYFRDLAAATVPWLHRPWNELQRAVAERRCGTGHFDDYLAAVAASLRPSAPGG